MAAAEAHIAAQLAELQQVHPNPSPSPNPNPNPNPNPTPKQVHLELHAARDEAAALKAAHVQRLRETHASNRSLAPLKRELALLQARTRTRTRA